MHARSRSRSCAASACAGCASRTRGRSPAICSPRESFRLGYDLWPLLRGRLQIDELVGRQAGHPARGRRARRLQLREAEAVRLRRRVRRGSRGGGIDPSPRARGRAPGPEGRRALACPRARRTFLRLDDLDFESRLALGPRARSGRDERASPPSPWPSRSCCATCGRPSRSRSEACASSPSWPGSPGGAVTGKHRLDLDPDLRWAMDLKVEDASVATLLKEAGRRPSRRAPSTPGPRSPARAARPPPRARGKAEIRDCQVSDSQVLKALAGVLQLPELARRASTSAAWTSTWRAAWPTRRCASRARPSS